jgi:hypothetical protein
VDHDDIDGLLIAIQSGNSTVDYDLNGNGIIDRGDAIHLVESILNSYLGDANLDGRVNAQDLNVVGLNWQASGDCLAWADGNFDGDDDVDAGDLNTIGLKWQQGVAAVAAARVPRAALAVNATSEIVDEAMRKFNNPLELSRVVEAAQAPDRRDSSTLLKAGYRRSGRRDSLARRSKFPLHVIDEIFAEIVNDTLVSQTLGAGQPTPP